MAHQAAPDLVVEKMDPERFRLVHEAIVETSEELFATGMISRPEISIDEHEAWTREIYELWDEDKLYTFHVLDADTDQLVGVVQISEVNRDYQMANVSYWVRASRSGEGIAATAVGLVGRYCFENLNLHRLEIVVSTENAASLKVAEKLGATREGLLRNRLQISGSPCDAYMHSLVPRDLEVEAAAQHPC